jgi:hypothetical protein
MASVNAPSSYRPLQGEESWWSNGCIPLFVMEGKFLDWHPRRVLGEYVGGRRNVLNAYDVTSSLVLMTTLEQISLILLLTGDCGLD